MNYDEIAGKLVQNGADVLDAVIGLEWIDSMPEDVTVIHFMDSEHCPLRYAFGDFLHGDRALAQKGYYNLGSFGFAHPHEFTNLSMVEMKDAYHAVNAAWWELISIRRNNQS